MIYKPLCLLVPVLVSLVKTRLNIISILYLMIDIKVIRFVDYISPLIFKIKMGSYISFYCLIAWCSCTPLKVKVAQLFKFHIIFISLQFSSQVFNEKGKDGSRRLFRSNQKFLRLK